MRCLDKHWNEIFSGMPPDFACTFKDHLVSVDIDNTVKWFFEKNSQEYWDYEQDFPCPLSPWDIAWFEAGAPKFSNSEGDKIEMGDISGVFRKLGWLVWRLPLKEDIDLPTTNVGLLIKAPQLASNQKALENLLKIGYDDEQMAAIRGRRAASVQMMSLFGFTWTEMVMPLLMEFTYLDAEGAMIAKSRGVLLLAPNQASMSESDKLHLVKSLQSPFLALYFSLCLLHTKNVTLKDDPSPFSGQKKQQHAQNSPKGTRFKVLDIKPLKEQVRYTTAPRDETAGDEIKRALHLCRGHFRRYTEESKLFGKFTGTFWIPAHVRGSKDAGEIKKDYRVKEPNV